jgi:drug/metabolite transporter (DMT)-like permease
MQGEKNNSITADLLLLLVALIWGFGFVAQRAGMEHIGPYAFNGIRFLLGGFCLLPLVLRSSQPLAGSERRLSLLYAGSLAGLVLFAGATLQQLGIQYTSAGKAGFITGLYVVIVPLIGLFLRQATSPGSWLGAILATIGMYLLSIHGTITMNPGDLLVLISAIFWAVHVLLLGYLSPRTVPVRLAMVQFLVCGLLSLLVALLVETITMTAIREAAIPILYGGIGSVGAGYTLQVVVQRKAHPAHAAILLSMESAFAALGGWWLLHEQLSLRAVIGCALMLAGMLISQLWPKSATS